MRIGRYYTLWAFLQHVVGQWLRRRGLSTCKDCRRWMKSGEIRCPRCKETFEIRRFDND